MQPRRRRRGWGGPQGWLRGGNEEGSSGHDRGDENDYGLEDLHSDGGTDDEDRPRKQVPKWAEGSDLMTALLNQCSMPPDQIFATVETPDLSSMFTQQRKRFFKRTSSACWEQPSHSFNHGGLGSSDETLHDFRYWQYMLRVIQGWDSAGKTL